MRALLYCFAFGFLLFSACSEEIPTEETPTEEIPTEETPTEEVPTVRLTKTIEGQTFTLKTPPDWKLIEDQGFDTYIGRITNGNITVYFDQGYLSFGNLDNVKPNDGTFYFREITINGDSAIIHKEKRVDGVRLSAYIEGENKLLNRNRLYVMDPENDELFLAIFKSHQFKENVESL